MKTGNKTIVAGAGVLIFSLMMIIGGCSSGPAHFKRMVSASDSFEQFQILPGHQYYYYGRPNAPLAMVAIKEGYGLVSPKWTPIELDEQALKTMVGRMLSQSGAEYNIDPNGAYIYNDSGENIGLWYSVWRLPVLHFTAEKEFTISDPVTVFPTTNRQPDDGKIIID